MKNKLRQFYSSGWAELCRGHLPIHVPGWKSSARYLLFSVVTNVVWIEIFYGEGKASVPALLLHSCWHPVACQHNYTPRCTLHNLLSSNEIIKVTAAFQEIFSESDINDVFFFSHFLEGKNKDRVNKKNSLFEMLQDSARAVTVPLHQLGPGSSFGKHKWSQQKTQRRSSL